MKIAARRFGLALAVSISAAAGAYANGSSSGSASSATDPVNVSIAACVTVPPVVPLTCSTSVASSSGGSATVCGESGSATDAGLSSGTVIAGGGVSCQIRGCLSGPALNITTWLPWFCDRGSSDPYPSEAWSSCVRWFFTGRWEGLASQATGQTNPTSSNRNCRAYNTAVATAYAEIHDEWACLSGALYSASGSRSAVMSMGKDVQFLLSSLSSDTSSCRSSQGTSSSGSGGSRGVPPVIFTFGVSSSSGSGGSASSSGSTITSAENTEAIQQIGFDTGSPPLNVALALAVRQKIPGCTYSGTGSACDTKTFQQVQSFCDGIESCLFPTVYPDSQAAYILGLPDVIPSPGAPGSLGKPKMIFGFPYLYCPAGYWSKGTSCPTVSTGS